MSRHKRKRIKSCLRLSHLPVPKTPAARPPAASCVNESELGLLDLLLLVFGILLLCFCCSCCQCVRALVKTWLPICMRRDCWGVLSIVATGHCQQSRQHNYVRVPRSAVDMEKGPSTREKSSFRQNWRAME